MLFYLNYYFFRIRQNTQLGDYQIQTFLRTYIFLSIPVLTCTGKHDKIIIIASHYYYEYPFDNKKVIDICEFDKNT